MNTTVRIAVAAALVIAAALVGVGYLVGRGDGTDPTTGGSPTSPPSQTATMPATGDLEPGRYPVPDSLRDSGGDGSDEADGGDWVGGGAGDRDRTGMASLEGWMQRCR